MLTPEYLADLPEEILELFYAAEQEILADMARRVATYDYWIPSAEYQRQKLREAGVLEEEILTLLSRASGTSEAELRRLMQEAGSMTLKADAAVYEAAGKKVPEIADSEPLRAILNAGYKATAQTMRNLCKTTTHTATMQFENVLDRAWLKVHSGAFDTDSAVRSAVKELAANGIQSIRYPSGRTDSIETAVRRAVVTGVNQTSAELQLELADELECDLVEVSAHAGARPEHAKWQGKIFSRSGEDKKYPPFRQSTGYGTGAGLCGWNCRHTFAPCFPSSPPVWTEEKLAELNAPKYEYGGKKLTEYEAQQIQRHNERQIRRWKREYAAMEAAGLDTSEASAKIKQWQAVQRDFLDRTGLKRQYSREQIGSLPKNAKAPVDIVTKSAIIHNRAEREEAMTLRTVGRIDIKRYSCVSSEIKTDEVIITDERIAHIQERHPNDYERYCSYIPEIVADPDYIIEANKPNTAVVLKEIIEDNEHFQLVLRLVVDGDQKNYKNSVITFLKIEEKRYMRYLRTKKILYKKE